LLRGQRMPQSEGIIVSLGETCLHIEMVCLQSLLLDNIVGHETVKLTVTFQRLLYGIESAEGLQDPIVGLFNIVDYRLPLLPQLCLCQRSACFLEADVQPNTVEL